EKTAWRPHRTTGNLGSTARDAEAIVPRVSDEKRSEDELDEKDEAAKDAPAAGETAASAEAQTEAEGDVAVAERASDEDSEEDEDAANPAAIARRVAALGADDEGEALAREEERKLAERRAAKKKGKKKGGLETAASKKLSKIGTRAEPKRSVAVAADADPLIERTAKLSDWAKKNQKVVQIVGAVLCVGLLGIAGFLYYDHKRETEASQILTKAVEAQRAQIGEPKKDDEDDDVKQLYFKTFDDRRAAALKQYKEVQSKFPGTGAAILARLAEGSLLLDKRDADGALAAFNEVKASPLAAADTEVKGRALEGLGFAHELKALANPAEKDKELDAALAAFKELETGVDAKGFKELAKYHQARVLMNKGDKEKAKELLLAVKEAVNALDDSVAPGLPTPPPFPYLKEVAMDRLHELDPAAVPKPHAGAGGGGMNLTPAQIRKMIEDSQKKGGHGGGH
ncbi:MAG: putative lipoprotein, partial [Labilithrix sp.]|nr:putative lipoprotein [Labilithrix sp.]